MRMRRSGTRRGIQDERKGGGGGLGQYFLNRFIFILEISEFRPLLRETRGVRKEGAGI